MQWTDDGMVLAARAFGEASAVVEIMSRDHGRHLGLMRGAKSKGNRALLQAGNLVAATWHARLDDHLGLWSFDLLEARAGTLMAGRLSLATLNHVVELLRLLPEREPHQPLYEAALMMLSAPHDPVTTGVMVTRMELRLLDDLGFGLDLSECAATGTSDDLAYVSPKSGRAVSRAAAEPWKDRMLPLPAFCLGQPGGSGRDVLDGLRLSGFFLNRHVLEPRRIGQLLQRESLVRLIAASLE